MNYLDKILLLMILLLERKKLFGICIPQTPCPNIFSYKYQNYGELNILVPNRRAQIIHLEVSYYSRTRIEKNLENTLKLYNTKEEVVENIANGRPVTFLLEYPFPNDPPRIQKIKFDGNVICIGDKDKEAIVVAIVDKYVNVQQIVQTFSMIVPNSNSQKPMITQPPKPQYTSQHVVQEEVPVPQHLQDRNQELSDNYVKNTVFIPTDPICGTITNSPAPMPLIVNGVSGEKQPWLAALFDNNEAKPTFFCAASLISARFLVTAAHCTISKTFIFIKIGGTDASSIYAQDGGIIRISEKIKRHPHYEHFNSNADIAIIKMSEPVSFTHNIRPVCLWPNKHLEENVILNKIAIIYGWGNDENGQLTLGSLKRTNIQIRSYDECKRMNILANVISDKTICAKGVDDVSGPCLGDSGGGLYIKIIDKWTMRGVISTAIGTDGFCDVQNFFSVYTDTGKYFEWIRSTVETL